MATAAPARPQAAPTHYAGFWIRVAAWFIDAVLLGIVNGVISAFFGGGLSTMIKPGQDASSINFAAVFATMGTLILVTLAIQFVYFAYLESSEKQATVGKMILGLKVTDLNGRRISFARAAGRFFGKFLSSMILGIGYIMVGFTEKKQGLHDMVASTLVVSTK
jgi:uncharacterized RDD family membrane protein YckC